MSELDPHVYHCEKCGRSIDDRNETPWLEVIGWERHRDQGGTNHIADRQQTGRARCFGCMNKIQKGLSPGQTVLL